MILQKAHAWKNSGSKMFSASHIAVFFDHQHLCKESSDTLVIFHRVGLQPKAASEKVVAWSHVVKLLDNMFHFNHTFFPDKVFVKDW